MANKKKNGGKKKAKGRAKGGKPSMPRQPSMAGAMSLAMGVCSVTNPFCEEAVGAKWPDNSYTKSATFDVRAIPVTVTTNATGLAALLFTPTRDVDYFLATCAGTTATYGAATGWTIATYPTTADVVRWRLTSMGIRIRAVVNKMTAAGSVRIRLFSPMGGTTLNALDINSTMADEVADIPVSRLVENDIYVVSKPLGDLARLFVSQTQDTNSTTFVNPGWQVIQVGVIGAAATTATLEISVYKHFEFIFADGNDKNAFTSKPPANSLAVREASASTIDKVGNFLEGTAQRVDAIYQSKALRVAGAIATGIYTGSPLAAIAYYKGSEPKRLMNVD